MTVADKKRILVVDDEENIRFVLDNILTREGYMVSLADGGREGLDEIERETVDFILCDVRMPAMDGIQFLGELKKRGVAVPVIMLSAYGTVDSAVDAIKAGAFDYVFKPFKPDEILLTLKKAEEHENLKRENAALREAAARKPDSGIVARSRVMNELLRLVDRVAQVKSPVLVTGESGTGKELVARAIHSAGPRKDHPFVPVNCGAIPGQLLESELFGHVRGAFTDAISDRQGLFREADHGTLFLDEVGELPPATQVTLLRAIQFEEVRPVGGSSPVKIDVRIVAATARDLSREAAGGRFREDLFYRLNVLPLTLPPLRKRPEDISLLFDHFLVTMSAKMGRPRPEISPEVIEALVNYSWPGNVRELENLTDRILVLSNKSRLDLDDIPLGIKRSENKTEFIPEEDLDLKAGVRLLEAKLIKEALNQTSGNRSEAARRLKISYPSLLAKIKAYGIN